MKILTSGPCGPLSDLFMEQDQSQTWTKVTTHSVIGEVLIQMFLIPVGIEHIFLAGGGHYEVMCDLTKY